MLQEAYVLGVSTRKVDDLVKALGLSGVSKSEVTRVCEGLDTWCRVGLPQPATRGGLPLPVARATYLKVRENGRVLSMAMVVAVGVKSSGEREVLGHHLGPTEDGAFSHGFLRSLVARGLRGVQLVISDAHVGLRQAIPAVFTGATWQRCRVHFMRNVGAVVPKSALPVVTGMIRTIFAQPDKSSASAQVRHVVASLEQRYAKADTLLEGASEDVLAYMTCPSEHHRQIHSTNTLERLNKEIKRRSDVVGIFPNREAAIRLVGAILAEQNDEWAVGKRYFSQESMAKLSHPATTAQDLLSLAPPSPEP